MYVNNSRLIEVTFRSSLWLLVMGSVTLATCIIITISTPLAGYFWKKFEDQSRSNIMTCVITSGCSTVLCLVASFGIQIWVKIRIGII